VAAYASGHAPPNRSSRPRRPTSCFFALDTLKRPYIVGSTIPRDAVEPALVADTQAIAALPRDSAGTELTADVDGERLDRSCEPVRSPGRRVRRVRDFPLARRELGAFRALQRTIGFALVLGLLLALASAYVLARQIAGPDRRLALATRGCRTGLQHRLDVPRARSGCCHRRSRAWCGPEGKASWSSI